MFNQNNRVLFGHLNYGNDIGKTEINIDYKLKNGKIKHSQLCYDVLSIKLNYHKDLKKIINDIEKEYRMLSIDFLRKTYHTSELIIQEKLQILFGGIYLKIFNITSYRQ